MVNRRAETLVGYAREDLLGESPDIDPETTASLGMRLVALLTEQIRGTLPMEREGGAAIRVDFAELRDAPR